MDSKTFSPISPRSNSDSLKESQSFSFPESKPAVLLLESGEVFWGTAIGAQGVALGEAVFNTSLSGYQEILSDPSYAAQIMTFTTPEIGNYGVRLGENESNAIQARGVIVKRCNPYRGRHEHVIDFSKWLERENIVGIAGVDTRKLTRILRSRGVCRALIASTPPFTVETLLAKLRAAPQYKDLDLVAAVSTPHPYRYAYKASTDDDNDNGNNNGDFSETLEEIPLDSFPTRKNTASHEAPPSEQSPPSLPPTTELRITVIDYGVKRNILRLLSTRGANVTVVPHTWTATQILSTGADGILLSNGPGDPQRLHNEIRIIQDILAQKDHPPLFGICLGHQLLALARQQKIFKLPFGHRGANHPIRYQKNSTIEITAQNHGFAVQSPGNDIENSNSNSNGETKIFSHTNLNDHTVAGLEEERFFSVQYHPEGAPGPHDSYYLFDKFLTNAQSHARTQNLAPQPPIPSPKLT